MTIQSKSESESENLSIVTKKKKNRNTFRPITASDKYPFKVNKKKLE